MRIAAGLVLALVAAAPAEAAAPGFCEDLRAMIRSVRDTPAFASVTRVRPPPALALFRQCRAHVEGFIEEVSCTVALDSAAPAVDGLAADALRCLPAARRLDHPEAGVRGEAWLSFELLVIKIGQERTSARITVEIPEG